MRFVRRFQESRFVMIEPPGKLFRRRILEVDDRILVTVKHVLVKQIAGTMQQTLVLDFGVRVNALPVEAREGCGRSHAIEAMAVVKQAKFHR